MRISSILKIPNLDLELLLTKALNRPRSFLYANPDYELNPGEHEEFEALYRRRKHGEPVAYILCMMGRSRMNHQGQGLYKRYIVHKQGPMPSCLTLQGQETIVHD